MLMCADQRRDSDNTSEEMNQCGRQLLQAQQVGGGVGPTGQQVGFTGSVTTVTAVLPFSFSMLPVSHLMFHPPSFPGSPHRQNKLQFLSETSCSSTHVLGPGTHFLQLEEETLVFASESRHQLKVLILGNSHTVLPSNSTSRYH